MTLQFKGTLKYRFRLSIFGYDIFAGPWNTQNVSFTEPVPTTSASISLPDGFSGSIGEAGSGALIALEWEGIPLLSETVPLTGSLPISVQPLKGVILAGTASVTA
jgi:hypothetical protein